MKTFLSFLLVLSLAVNVGFLTGCAAFHDAVYGNPCKYATGKSPEPHPGPVANDDGKAELVRIAESLHIRTGGKSASTLASDIRYVTDRETEPPAGLSDNALTEAKKRLPPECWSEVEELQRFATDLQGKRVIVYIPEE